MGEHAPRRQVVITWWLPCSPEIGRKEKSKPWNLMNENGEMLADLCAFNNMVIGGNVLPHRRIHKATWVSPDHITEHQIDHICIGRKFRRSMQDVRAQIGADAASDHHLVLARMKMKLKKRDIERSTRTQCNVDFLKDRLTTETFRLSVR